MVDRPTSGYTAVPDDLDVRAIRWGHGPQADFGRKFGFSAASVRDWEQGRRRPTGAARRLLELIARDAAGVERLMRAAGLVPPPR